LLIFKGGLILFTSFRERSHPPNEYLKFNLYDLEAVSKPQIRLKDKVQADPPSLKRLWRDRRKSAAPPVARDEQYILRRFARQTLGLR
jgi:hypothetical protein